MASIWPFTRRGIRSAQQASIYAQLQSAQLSQATYQALGSKTFAQYAAQQQRALQNYVRQSAGLLPTPDTQHDPDPDFPTTMGWRSWYWDLTERKLYSPHMGTAWNGSELRCETWDERDVIRGVAGIHALLVPVNWTRLVGPSDNFGGLAQLFPGQGGKVSARIGVTGIVERFGKYVLGTEGWRAEWVIIRKLAAPTDEIGLALEEVFPDVEVIYGDR